MFVLYEAAQPPLQMPPRLRYAATHLCSSWIIDVDLCGGCRGKLTHQHRLTRERMSADQKKLVVSQQSTTTSGVLMNAFALFAKRPLWATVSSDQQLNWVTYQEVFVRVCAVGRGLQARLKRSDFVAIGGENTPEWLICDYACQIFGFVSVPIHTHLTTDRIQFILEQCKVSLILCSTAIAERLGPDCQLPMYFLDALPPNPRALGVLEAEGRERPLTIDPRVGDELVTVVWTSGSTGDAKGVMISERLYHSEISAPWLLPFDLRRVFFSPLAHTTDRKNARRLSSFS